MPQAKSDLEWLKGHLNTLVDVGSRVRVIDPDIFNEFGSWTALKLIGVKYWQSVYSTIIPEYLRELGRDSMAYLDVMAGSGLNRIREPDCYLAGSSILAAAVPRKPFDYIIAIENNKTRAATLARRLRTYREPSTYRVVSESADERIADTLAELAARRAHFMAFVDYQGMKGFSRESMDLLLHAPCDIWFTYFPNIKRSFVLSEYDDANLEVCRAFFGRDLVDGATTYEELVGAWLDHLRRYREFVYPFTIQSGQGYYYLLVFLTRMTRGGSPYVRAAADLDRRISAIHGDFVQTVLRILSKGQTQLDMY